MAVLLNAGTYVGDSSKAVLLKARKGVVAHSLCRSLSIQTLALDGANACALQVTHLLQHIHDVEARHDFVTTELHMPLNGKPSTPDSQILSPLLGGTLVSISVYQPSDHVDTCMVQVIQFTAKPKNQIVCSSSL